MSETDSSQASPLAEQSLGAQSPVLEAEFMEWALLASHGSIQAAERMLARPAQVKILLDRMSARKEGCESLIAQHRQACAHPDCKDGLEWGYASGVRPASRFLERGLPARPQDLVEQYAALQAKDGRLDFKADIQGIERAMLSGCLPALHEMVERSPMALWAMDFSLSEYEAENVLAFCAKYAPAGADLEIIAYLRGVGASLPQGRMELGVGWAMAQAEGISVKSVEQCARAMMAAGYAFNAADGFNLMQSARIERAALPDAPSGGMQKILWLDWMQEEGFADWRSPMDRSQAEAALSQLPASAGDPHLAKRCKEFLDFIDSFGPAGLGAWMGLSCAPLRDEASWTQMGHWLCERGLAVEAHLAAQHSGAAQSQSLILPWAERQALRSSCAGAGLQEPSKAVALRI